MPIVWVQEALDRLITEGNVEVSVDSLGHRSAFVAAALLTVPGASARATSPPHIVLAEDVGDDYRGRVAGDLNTWWSGPQRSATGLRSRTAPTSASTFTLLSAMRADTTPRLLADLVGSAR